MIRAACIALLCVLCSCGTFQALHARSFIPGHTEPDVLACMGPPDSKTPTGSPGESVLQWSYNQAGTDFDAELGVYTLKLGRPGICHAAIRFDQGYATSLHFTDVDIGPTNPDSICGRMVADCLSHIDHTALPPGYDDAAVLTGAPIVIRQGLKQDAPK